MATNQKYSLTCSCGHIYSVKADSREEAVKKMKDMMTPEFVQKHMEEMHPGEASMTVEQVHAFIDEKIALA